MEVASTEFKSLTKTGETKDTQHIKLEKRGIHTVWPRERSAMTAALAWSERAERMATV